MTQGQINPREANRPLHEALALRVPTAPTAFVRQLCKSQTISLNRVATDAVRLTAPGEPDEPATDFEVSIGRPCLVIHQKRTETFAKKREINYATGL